MKKTFKRFFSAIMMAVITISAISLIGNDLLVISVSAKNISSYKVGDIIEFGVYPQSRVIDQKTISELNKISKTWENNDYMKYCDINYNGNKYRAVSFSNYRNSYQKDNGYLNNQMYYFKFEPIKWQVLDPSDGYIMCTIAIDSQAYQKDIYYKGSYSYYNSKNYDHYASDWETSTIRTWLNDSFYKVAFDSTEKTKIKNSYLDNKSSRDEEYDSKNTYDKIFFISYFDAINRKYGELEHFYSATDYARCQGCRDEENYAGVSGNYDCWLRSAYSTEYVSCIGSYSGTAYNMGDGPDVSCNYIGVVPACKLNPESEIGVKQNKLGDLDNDNAINSSDALMILQYAVGSVKLDDKAKTAADVTKDGQINSADALKVLQYSVGQITEL